jgi:phage terminase small subunit
MALTPKQQRFVNEYLIDLNATQAAARAGYSKKTANEQGSRLLANVSVSTAITQRMNERSGRLEITQDMVLRELAKIGFSDIRKVVRWGETQGRDGLKVKLHDKKGTLVDIGRHLGMFAAPGHPELDAELKRLEIQKRRAEIKRLEGGNDDGPMPQRIEVVVTDARRPNAEP